MWLNRYDVENACRMFDQDPLLGSAARFLSAYVDIVDENSDGWPYARSASKAAETLTSALYYAMLPSHHEKRQIPTEEVIKAGVRRVKSFLTKHWPNIPKPAYPTPSQGRLNFGGW